MTFKQLNKFPKLMINFIYVLIVIIICLVTTVVVLGSRDSPSSVKEDITR